MQADDETRERARKRVKDLRDFAGHLAIYLVVMVVLVVIDLVDGDRGASTVLGLNWAYWPMFGWGIAVVIHGVSFFMSGRVMGPEWEERKVEQYMEEERRRLEHH
jgi:hypothetical protein